MNSKKSTLINNPMATNGFDFIEFASPKIGDLEMLFTQMGFLAVAKHRIKQITLYRQGEINFLINREPGSYASCYAVDHGPSACAMAFRVGDANFAHRCAVSLGATAVDVPTHEGDLTLPAIRGIGNSLLYFVDQYETKTIFDTDFDYLEGVDRHPKGTGLTYIDHLTHNVYQGQMEVWTEFYEKFFNFHQQRSFAISGKKTGMISRAMISPCGKIRIPINESTDGKSQIAEYLSDYKGEGIQHIAFGTDDISSSVELLRKKQISFMTVPSSYYQMFEERLPGHGQDLIRLANNHILMDGEKVGKKVELLLQIFTQTVIGPIFFEVIQRMGHEGFGHGNITALFEAMEREQQQRGVL